MYLSSLTREHVVCWQVRGRGARHRVIHNRAVKHEPMNKTRPGPGRACNLAGGGGASARRQALWCPRGVHGGAAGLQARRGGRPEPPEPSAPTCSPRPVDTEVPHRQSHWSQAQGFEKPTEFQGLPAVSGDLAQGGTGNLEAAGHPTACSLPPSRQHPPLGAAAALKRVGQALDTPPIQKVLSEGAGLRHLKASSLTQLVPAVGT